MTGKERQALSEHVRANREHYHDLLVEAYKDVQQSNDMGTWNRGTYVCVDADRDEYSSDITAGDSYLDPRTWSIEPPECIAYIPAWCAECMDTEAAARADRDVDLTEYDKACEAAETSYDEPDFCEFMEEHYPDKLAEYDNDAADMQIYAFADSEAKKFKDGILKELKKVEI